MPKSIPRTFVFYACMHYLLLSYFSDLLDSEPPAFIHPTHSSPNLLGEPAPVPTPQQPNLRRRSTNPVHIGVPPMTSAQLQNSANSSVGEGDGGVGIGPTTDSGIDDRDALKQAVNSFRVNLGLEESDLIKDVIHLKDVPAGAYLAKEDTQQV
jgi:hypothetical protein